MICEGIERSDFDEETVRSDNCLDFSVLIVFSGTKEELLGFSPSSLACL